MRFHPPKLGHVLVVAAMIGLFACAAAAADKGRGYLDRRDDFAAVRAKALKWIDQLEVDVAVLQANGVKGKKKLGEILATYWAYYDCSKDEAEKAAILRRVRALCVQTGSPAYHDLATCSDTQFKQNSMSYLRVMSLMQRFGLDTTAYLAQVKRVKPRLDAHLAQRGAWQRKVFAAYYERFNLTRPAILDDADGPKGVIERRVPYEQFLPKQNIYLGYHFTHDIFVAFDYGNRRQMRGLTTGDVAYAKGMLPRLAGRCILNDDPDLLGELLSCMTYLRMQDHPAYAMAVEFLLDSQNDNGSWGDYSRQRYGPYVDQHRYLHTTNVAAKALIQAFSGRWD